MALLVSLTTAKDTPNESFRDLASFGYTTTHHADHFIAPCLVLKESLRPSEDHEFTTHDVIETYNTLIYKIRQYNEKLSRENAEVLALSLQRDLDQKPGSMILPFAVRLLSNIFALDRINSAFIDVELASLLVIAMKLCSEHQGPVHKLLVFTLKTQSLSFSIFQLVSSELLHLLSSMIQNCDDHYAAEGLLILERILRLHGSSALPSVLSSRIISTILQRFSQTPQGLIFHASSVVSALALAKLQSSDPCESFSDLSAQLAESLDLMLEQAPQSQNITTLNTFLLGEASSPSPQSASCLLASLIVLYDSQLFSNPRGLQFFLDAFQLSLPQMSSQSEALYHCLVWAYSRIPLHSGFETSAFDIMLQEVREGIGTALVTTLLNKDVGSPERAICVIQKMLSTQSPLAISEALGILEKLVEAGEEDEALMNQDAVLPMSLFSHGGIIKPDLLHLIPNLNPSHLESHWEDLMSLWKMAVQNAAPFIAERRISSKILTHIFQRLLLSRSQLTQHYGHLTTERRVYEQLARLLSEILPISLVLVYKFWGVVIRVFDASCLDYVGRMLLRSALHLTASYSLGSEAGSKLLHSLVREVDIGSTLNILKEMKPDANIQRCIWSALVNLSCHQTAGWDSRSLVAVLRIPLGVWYLDETEQKIWRTAMARILQTIPWGDFLTRFTEDLGDQAVSLLCFDPSVIIALLSPQAQLTVSLTPLPERFFGTLSSALTYLYPPSGESKTRQALSIFSALQGIVEEAAPNAIVPLLKELTASLETWFGDAGGHLPVEQYNSTLMEFYKKILARLEEQESSHELMLVISPILASVFETIPEPHIGPDAFVNYWKKCWQGKEKDFCSSFGKTLVDCLTSLWGSGPWDVIPDSEDDIQSWDHDSFVLDCTRAVQPDLSDIFDGPVERSSKRRRISRIDSPQVLHAVNRTQDETWRDSFSAPNITSPMSTLRSIKKSQHQSVFPPTQTWSRNRQFNNKRGLSGVSSITSPRDTMDVINLPSPEAEMDYDNWEVCITTPEACRIREELSDGTPTPLLPSAGPTTDGLGSPFRIPEKATAFVTPPQKESGSSTKLAALRQAYQEFLDPENSSLIESQDLEEARTMLQNMEQEIKKQGKRKAR